MSTAKLSLDLALVLPDIPDERDACVGRLIALLEGRGIDQAHVVREDGKARLCLHYDPGRVGMAEVRRLASAAGASIAKRYAHASLRIDGMDCPACADVIEHALGRIDGVLEARVSYAAERLRLEYDNEKTSRRLVERRLEALGYRIVAAEEHGWWHEYRELVFSLAAGASLLAGWLGSRAGWPAAASSWLYWAAYAFGGFFTLRDALQSLRSKRFDIDTLMLVAAAGAAMLGHWAEGALLLFLFSLGHALEHIAMDRARQAIEALGELAPRTALVRRDGADIELPVANLLRGDRIIVKAGERIAADGTVLEGRSTVDQSPVTGESMPVDKDPGDPVFAGTVNGERVLLVEVTRLASESTLARMVRLVSEAQTQKSPTERFTDRFARVFVPVVLGGAVLLVAVPLLLGHPFTDAFYRAMAVLVAASPCALAIGTPAAVLSAVARAAQAGILIKGGAHLETLGQLNAMAFDKTGTITEGRPRLTDLVSFGPPENDLLLMAAAVESRSDHPLARAIVAAARERGLQWSEPAAVESVTGKGIRATLDGRQVEIGNLKLFAHETVNEAVTDAVERLESSGRTTMLVRTDGRFAGIVGLMDTPRAGVAAVLAQLRALGIARTVMLTGDNERVARAVAREVGLAEVRAGLLPEDKVEAIASLIAEHGLVAMVGDGVNDAPALARASVGVAMGGAGSDVALETADVALMGDDPGKLPFAIALGHAARRAIRQNLFIALGAVALLIPATLLGWAGIGLAVLVHEGSTVVVVLNALRLLAFRADAGTIAA
ncbi:MAG TPA: cation-translocating P-type ATPase [Burkholderiaceae bacterium]|nr:cation-translocating P-type ATPase [Burkholderiaceae bacterium]